MQTQAQPQPHVSKRLGKVTVYTVSSGGTGPTSSGRGGTVGERYSWNMEEQP